MAASANRALIGALAANLAVAATKFLVGTITRSTVMIAEGIHSLVDTGNSGDRIDPRNDPGQQEPPIFLTVVEDTAGLLGLALAAAGLALSHYLGVPQLDSIASVLIGGVLVVESILVGVECRGLITGEAARPMVIARIRELITRYPELGELQELRTLQLGPDAILVALRVQFPAAMLVAELEAVGERLERELRVVYPAIKHFVFDVRPLAAAEDR